MVVRLADFALEVQHLLSQCVDIVSVTFKMTPLVNPTTFGNYLIVVYTHYI